MCAARKDGTGGPAPGTVQRKLVPLITDASGKAVFDPARHCRLARSLCLLGALDRDLAEEFGISLATYYRWRERYHEFDEAIRSAKAIADAEVAASVHKVATGFTKIENRTVVTAHGVEIVPVEVSVDPDAVIGLRWLKQRQPRNWSEPAAAGDDMSGEQHARVMSGLEALIGSPSRSALPPTPGLSKPTLGLSPPRKDVEDA